MKKALIIAFAALSFGVALPVNAQQDPAEERATSFVGVEGAVDEDVPGGTLLIAAYAIVWVMLFLYLMRMARLSADVSRRVADLSNKRD